MTTLKRIAGQPTWLLSQAHFRAHRLLADTLGAEGMRGYHVRLLAALEQYGPSSQASLSRATGIDRSDVVACLDDLTGWGLAHRDDDPEDRRRNIVTITPAGITRLTELDTVLASVQEAVLAPLSPAERPEFVRMLTKLTE